MILKSIYKRYIMPGIIFQSVVIAGGYGTGREMIEFFLQYGPRAGLMSMLIISSILWGLTCVLTFELSRKYKLYNYKDFFKKLLGRFWFAYDILYLILMILILGVIASTSGRILNDVLGIEYYKGVACIIIIIGILVCIGKKGIEGFLSYWSFILYIVYALYFIVCFTKFSPSIFKSLNSHVIRSGWAIGGVKYSLYNLGIIPAVLFSLNYIQSRREAVVAGFFAGFIGIFPGLLLYLSFLSSYPNILMAEIPTSYQLNMLNISLFPILFQIVLFGTLIETGSGLIFSYIERVRGVNHIGKLRTFSLSVVILLLGGGAAKFGLSSLVRHGYGKIAWGFLIVYIIPLFTVGVYMIFKND